MSTVLLIAAWLAPLLTPAEKVSKWLNGCCAKRLIKIGITSTGNPSSTPGNPSTKYFPKALTLISSACLMSIRQLLASKCVPKGLNRSPSILARVMAGASHG